jgi:hypothetical protein
MIKKIQEIKTISGSYREISLENKLKEVESSKLRSLICLSVYYYAKTGSGAHPAMAVLPAMLLAMPEVLDLTP